MPNDSYNPDQSEASDRSHLSDSPLVSVLMITYNHAEYLAQAIQGVLAQQCSFSFELIIGEDFSSDHTRDIALEYQQRHPEVIRVIFSSDNVGINRNARRIFSAARGKYIAYCEGDDYWCSPLKLAKQVELLRSDPSIGVVHTDWVTSKPGRNGWIVNWSKSAHHRIPAQRLQGYIFPTFHYPKILRTCTRVARRECIENCFSSDLGKTFYMFGDTVHAAYTTSRWKVGYVPEVTAVYRCSPNSALRSGTSRRLAFLKSCLDFDTDARTFFCSREDYPKSFRWETLLGLFLWAIKAHDFETARFALADLRAHFTPVEFVYAAWNTLFLRRPTLFKNHRKVPTKSSTDTMRDTKNAQ